MPSLLPIVVTTFLSVLAAAKVVVSTRNRGDIPILGFSSVSKLIQPRRSSSLGAIGH
jgi:hypothetical protein